MIEKLTQRNIKSIIDIENSIKSKDWTYENILSSIDKDDYIYYGYLLEGELIGYYCIRIVLDICELYMISVRKDKQGYGIGSIMIKHLKEIAKEFKCSKIELEVRKENEIAQHLYLKHNFKIVGSRKNYYENPTDDAILMTLYL
jgi:ribosomal-protein-alanine N-acetyltransferase